MWLFVAFAVVLNGLLAWIAYEQREMLKIERNRRNLLLSLVESQRTYIGALETSQEALRAFHECNAVGLTRAVKLLIENLEYWMPDETLLAPDQEGEQWYKSVDALYNAKKLTGF